MSAETRATPLGPWDANQAELAEWHDTEGIGEDEQAILLRLAMLGTSAVSNALWKQGYSAALIVFVTVLEAAFQVGRSIGQREKKGAYPWER